MKKLLSIMLALLMCCAASFTVCAEESAPCLFDEADVLTDSEESTLSARMEDLNDTYEVDFAIAVFSTLGGADIDSCIELYYDENGYGCGTDKDGVLLLVDMQGRDFRIFSNGLGADAVTLDEIDSITETISPAMSDGDYAEAFTLFLDECEYQIDGEINGFPFDYVKSILIALAIGLVIAFIVTAVMRGQLKSVRQRLTATEYTKPGSMQVTLASDLFLYKTVTRRKRETDNQSSGSSGSRRNVGGGSF